VQIYECEVDWKVTSFLYKVFFGLGWKGWFRFGDKPPNFCCERQTLSYFVPKSSSLGVLLCWARITKPRDLGWVYATTE